MVSFYILFFDDYRVLDNTVEEKTQIVISRYCDCMDVCFGNGYRQRDYGDTEAVVVASFVYRIFWIGNRFGTMDWGRKAMLDKMP